MENVVLQFPEPKRKADAIPMPIPAAQLDEHSCTRQVRILNAWLVDCSNDPDVSSDWVIERLQQAIHWVAMRKIFNGK